ncbi:CHASE2 domain-containing protein [Pseudomonadota bacterium]
MPKPNKKRLPALLISLAVVIVTLGLSYTGALNTLENISYDWRLKHFRSNTQAPSDVAVILIDDASLNAMSNLVGRWPWPRSVHADLIDFLSLGGPRAIIFDVLFSEQESFAADKEAASSDQRLIQATAEAGNVIHAMQIYRDEEDEVNKGLLKRPLPASAKAHSVTVPSIAKPSQNTNTYHLPLDGLSEASAGLGVVTSFPNDDGVYRHSRLIHHYQGDQFASLGTSPLFLNHASASLPDYGEKGQLVNYYGQITNYSMGGVLASAQKVMRGELDDLIVDPYEFENKIVFIGSSAVGLVDRKATPLSSITPGVMIHASIIANILNDDLLKVVPTEMTAALVVLLALSTSFLVLYPKQLYFKIVTPTVIAGLYAASNYYTFSHNLVMEMAPPLVAIFMAAVFCSGYLQFTEGRDKRRVRNMLAQYVSPAVLGTIVNQYEDYVQAEVGAEEELSILFSDIRGFTSLSEAVPAVKVVEMLNHYFSEMNEAIFDARGTIDKFIGDAIMAFWGAPIREEQHADLALQAAIDMHERLKDVNRWLREKNYPEIQVGIGINTGKVILGNIGSVQKLDYTVIGDNVNLASRLEGLTKPYGSTIVISEYTYKKLTIPVSCHTLDLVQVKGKSVPIRIYGVVLDESAESASALAELGEQAFSAYLNQQWDQAISCYKQLPNEVLKKSFIERCEAYKEQPPPETWDGVFTMTTK